MTMSSHVAHHHFFCGIATNITTTRKINDEHLLLSFSYGLQVGNNNNEQCNYSSSFCYGLQARKNDDKHHDCLSLFCYGLQA